MSKINISFNLKEPKATKETPILLVLRWDGQRLKTTTNERIKPTYWSLKNQRSKDVTAFNGRDTLNKNLDVTESKIKEVYRELSAENQNVDKSEIKSKIDIILGRQIDKNIPRDFIPYVQYLIENKTGQINPDTKRLYSERTFSKYNRVAKLCKELDPNISFKSFDKKFYSTRFEKFLISKNFALNTIGKYTQALKTILVQAKIDKVLSTEYFKKYPVHKVESFNIYLTDSEIDQMYNLDLSAKPHLDRVRDIFVLGTQTGLRFSDIYRIKKHLINGEVLSIKTYKNNNVVEIPLFEKSKEILSKYNYELPKAISNQKFNEYIKEVGKRAGLTEVVIKTYTRATGDETTAQKKYELISSHTMRRSFCTNLYLKEYPILGICAISGHKTESEFIKYVKVSKQENAKRLIDFFKEKQKTVKMYGNG